MVSRKDWKTNPVIVGLLLVFLWPLGLAVMWLNGWPARTKAIITGVLLIPAVLVIVVLASLAAAVHSIPSTTSNTPTVVSNGSGSSSGSSSAPSNPSSPSDSSTTDSSGSSSGSSNGPLTNSEWPAVWQASRAANAGQDGSDFMNLYFAHQVDLQIPVTKYDPNAYSGGQVTSELAGGVITLAPDSASMFPAGMKVGDTIEVQGIINRLDYAGGQVSDVEINPTSITLAQAAGGSRAATTATSDTSTASEVEPSPPTSGSWVAYAAARRSRSDADHELALVQQAGLSGAGIFWSNDAPGASPNWWIVYGGYYPDQASAQQAVQALHDHGWSDAYVKQFR